MANTLVYRKIRSCGTLFGGPPIVETFLSAAAVNAGDPVRLASGKVQTVGVVGAVGTNDTWNDGDVGAGPTALCGIALNAATAADQTVKVAMFAPGQCFEGTHVGSSLEGDAGVVEVALAQTLLGSAAALVKLDPAITRTPVINGVNGPTYTVPAGTWGVTTTTTSAIVGTIIRINFGYTGEDIYSGHGVIGDKATRVLFQIPNDQCLLVA